MAARDWPSREQWAERHRNAYWEGDNPHPYTNCLSPSCSRRSSRYDRAPEPVEPRGATPKLGATEADLDH